MNPFLTNFFWKMQLISLTLLLCLFTLCVHGQSLDRKKISKKLDSSVVTIKLYDNLDNVVKIASGVVIHKNGTIVTNAHVFNALWLRGEVYNDFLGNQYQINKTSIQADAINDIAFFTINYKKLYPISVGNSDSVEKGDPIYCMGSPEGMNNLFTDGMVAGLNTLVTSDNKPKTFIQFTAKTLQGSSGGALVDQQGRLIGITTGSIQNKDIGFAIPVNRLAPYIKEIGIDLHGESKDSSNVSQLLHPIIIIKEDSLKRRIGILSVWTNCTNCTIDVFIDGEPIGQINKALGRQPECGGEGTLKKTVSTGLHKITGIDKGHGLRWAMEEQVRSQECSQVKFRQNSSHGK